MANALVKKFRNELTAARKAPRNAILDFTRGALMGGTTDVLGYPVDLMTMAMRPFGYNVEKPVGGSDWLADRFTSPTGSIAETAGRTMTGMVTPGPNELLGLMGVTKRAPVNELITYHGSPHRINNVDAENPVGKFDISKVGTGEGAQAYGYGIYLAESPGVAKTYMRPVGFQTPRIDEDVVDALGGLGNLGFDSPTQAIAAIRKEPKTWMSIWDAARPEDAAAAAKINEYIAKYPDGRVHPSFYTVDLPDEHIAKMLDWDAPLSEQPEAVRAQINALLDSGVLEADSVKAIRDYDSPGSVIYKMIANDTKAAGEAMDAYPGAQGASRRLHELGIPGIKYFDGGSRSAGKGTRNFVIFSGDTAKILKRE